MSSSLAAFSRTTSVVPPHFDRPTYLMCSPQWFDVDYVINPWMAGNVHRPSRDRAFAQWRALYERLHRLADIRVLPAEPGCPDMTFVAHTAIVQHGLAAISSFAHSQRQVEERHLRRWFEDAGFLLWGTPHETAFEGEGDAIFDETGEQLWVAHGLRTSAQSHAHLARAWHVPVHSLQLVDPRFYHLDLCLTFLRGGYVLYYPEAFDVASRRVIERAFPADRRIVAGELEATQFACNVIGVGTNLLMSRVTTDLPARLAQLGFTVEQLDLSEFLRGGGSAKSLALRLSNSALSH